MFVPKSPVAARTFKVHGDRISSEDFKKINKIEILFQIEMLVEKMNLAKIAFLSYSKG